MALQCGTSNDGCQGKAGTYLIEYQLPIAGSVRYLYPGGAWQEIPNGTRFETIQNSPTPGQGVGVTYRVGVYTECEMRVPRTVNDCPGQLLNPKVFLASRRFDVRGPIGSITFVPWQQGTLCRHLTDFGNYGRFNVVGQNNVVYGLDTVLNYFRSTEPTNFMECIANEWVGARFFYKFKPVKSFIERADGKPETGQRTCTFKVFDRNNRLLFERTEAVCPEATIIPSTYGNKETFRILNRDATKLLSISNISNGVNSTVIKLGNTIIKRLDSPSELFPRVCWDCTEDEKCPENTCSVDCGDRICCYNSLGISVKELKK